MLTWTAGSARKCVGAGGEPDALTAHVRFWEGAVPNWRWSRYCDTTTGNQVATVKTNFDLRSRGTALLTGTGQWKEVRFVLPHARFAGRSNGADFRLAAGGRDLVISHVAVRLLEK